MGESRATGSLLIRWGFPLALPHCRSTDRISVFIAFFYTMVFIAFIAPLWCLLVRQEAMTCLSPACLVCFLRRDGVPGGGNAALCGACQFWSSWQALRMSWAASRNFCCTVVMVPPAAW